MLSEERIRGMLAEFYRIRNNTSEPMAKILCKADIDLLEYILED